jgi:Alr-MurF fusion protein
MNFDSPFFERAEPLFDSRKILLPAENYIFFALATSHRDGHDFVAWLYAQGVRRFVVEPPKLPYLQTLCPLAEFISAPNPLLVLQDWAAWHRASCKNTTVVGITGSNGKTIVKEWLYQLLEQLDLLVKSPQSYNSQLGVPLSVLALRPVHRWAIFEAGISQADEMSALAKIIQPNIGLFTNIGDAHAEGFESLRHKIAEKAALFATCSLVFYNANQPIIGEVLAQMYPRTRLIGIHIGSDTPQKPYDDSPDSFDFRLLPNVEGRNQTEFSLFWAGALQTWILPFRDVASIQNSLQAVAIALYLGLPCAYLGQQLAHLRNVAMRLEQKQGSNNTQIIDDTYTNDPEGMAVGLDFLHSQARYQRRTIIFSQFHNGSAEIYTKLAARLTLAQVSRLVAVGDNIMAYRGLFEAAGISNMAFFANTDALLEGIKTGKISFNNESILVKGGRNFRFEQVVQQLQQRRHDTILSISLAAIRHNYRTYRALLAPQTKTMAMVKAFAYGSGSTEVARLLSLEGVDYLGVAYPDEGVALRRHGIDKPIMVMNVSDSSFSALLEYDLQPVLYNWRTLRAFHAFLSSQNKRARVHIEIDTGMRRLGFDVEADAHNLTAYLSQAAASLQIESIFSHLAAAEAPLHDDFTRQQIATFRNFTQYYMHNTATAPILHLLNSAGATRWRAEAEFDMVRLGICLHGIDSTGLMSLATVAELRTTISQIRTLTPEQTVGYNRNGTSQKVTRVATIAIGYADGFLRTAGNGRAKVWINGQLCPTIGNVCMDMAFVDLGDLPADEGDEVIIFGNRNPIERLAQSVGTIPYELLTNVGMRIPRVFFQD